MTLVRFETGQGVRWRGRRWRVLQEETNGVLTLVGVESVNRDQTVRPLVALEADELVPDELPLPPLDVAATDRARWRALHRAWLTTMAGGREQLVGLDWGAIAVEPYQLVPLLRVARSVRPRLLIADDTGLGKTAEAGIVLRWLAQRHQAGRVLVVTRAAPEPDRWRQELWTKFGFRFDILTSGADFAERRRQAPTVNVFAQQSRLIVSMTLCARQLLLDELRKCPTPFDVVIVDEAHHLAERGAGTKRLALLGRQLSAASADGTLLLLTATPHDGKTDSFLSLLRLLDPFAETGPGEVPVDVARRLVVRRLKTEVTLSGGRRFVPPEIQIVSTLGEATLQERDVDRPLSAYLAWLAEEEARYEGAGARQKAKGCQFLAGVYRKRFGSSVAALRATLRRRLGLPPAPEDTNDVVPYVESEASDPEDDAIDPAAELDPPPPDLTPQEAELARDLLAAAERVPAGRDAKLQALVKLLSGPLQGEKVVVFTEYRDTLRAALRRLTAERVAFVTFHGDTPDAERVEAVRAFIHDPDVRVFLATDAASEGKNLQRSCHHLVHLDVPWNPNRYAQRNGRIDRYGQARTPNVWALVAADRRAGQGRPEYRALELVVEKLKLIQDELGSVGPVLPSVSGNVKEVLSRARADVEAEVDRLLTPDQADRDAEADLSKLAVHNRAEIAAADGYVARLGSTEDFESQIGGLLETAFRGWDDGGRLVPLDGAFCRVEVPRRLRAQLGVQSIERATFRRQAAVDTQDDDGADVAEFMSPAHPLVEATLRALRDEAATPGFAHRFDVEAAERPSLVCSFAVRFVDGDGRTVEERLEAVEVDRGGRTGKDSEAALGRLGIDSASTAGRPDPTAVDDWSAAWPSLYPAMREEAERRAEFRRQELVVEGRRLTDEEVGVLALWHSEEARRIERLVFGASVRITLEQGEAYARMTAELEAQHQARLDALRDRSAVRVASIDLIGGRLLVLAAP
ncbi:MAG: DEAD/DEAH box helicase [Acidimicrobiales bacterium]